MFVHRTKYLDFKHLTLTAAVDQGRRIAAGVGGWYGPEYGAVMDRAVKTGVLTLNTSTDQRIRMLLAKRLDIVVADLLVGYHHAIEEGRVLDVVELPHVLNSDPVHFMLSRKTVSEDEVAGFDHAIARVMQSDDYRRLIEKYKPVIGVPTD